MAGLILMDMKCFCGGLAVPKKNLRFNGFDIGGWVCKKCREIFYNPEKTEKILVMCRNIREYDVAIEEELICGRKCFVAYCMNLGIASQGRTIQQAVRNLSEAIELYFQEQ